MVRVSIIYVMLLLSLQVEFVDSQASAESIIVDRSVCGSKVFGISSKGIVLVYKGDPLTEPYCNITIRKRIVYPAILLCVGVYHYENVYEMETFYDFNAFFSRKINGYKSTNTTNKVAKRINDYVVKNDKIVEDDRSFPIHYACKDGPLEVIISFKENVDRMVSKAITAKYDRTRPVKIGLYVVEIDAVRLIDEMGQPDRNGNDGYEDYTDMTTADMTTEWISAGITCVSDVSVMVILLGVALVSS